MALCCPSTNSYCRFGVGLAAPMNLFFSESNRSAAVRIPAYSKNPTEQRVEYRLPDALCNPYLVMAAQLMAGLDGISKKTDPTKEGFGPFDVNNYELPPEERAKIKSGPTSLADALNALAKDSAFLTAGKVFPKEVIDTWINLKMTELNEVKKRPHPYEYELYYDF
jgi:glutamine synthetase